MRGELIWFNDEKGHGFIRTEEGERLCVERAAFVAGAPSGRCGGTVVSFERSAAGDEPRAVSVVVEEASAAGRARHRRGGRPARMTSL